MDTTKPTRSRPPKDFEKNALVSRLERNQKDLMQLRTQLSSYRCEPKTYSLFERIESLKNGLDTLSKTNTEIITSLKERRKKVDDYMERAKQQFSEFNTLHRGIEDYIQGSAGADHRFDG